MPVALGASRRVYPIFCLFKYLCFKFEALIKNVLLEKFPCCVLLRAGLRHMVENAGTLTQLKKERGTVTQLKEERGTVTQLTEERSTVTQLKNEDVDYGSGDGGGVGHHLAGAADTAGSPA